MNEAPPVAEPHPDVLTKEDFAMIGFILGAYVGNLMQRMAKEGRDPVHDPEVVRAHELTKELNRKLTALRDTM